MNITEAFFLLGFTSSRLVHFLFSFSYRGVNTISSFVMVATGGWNVSHSIEKSFPYNLSAVDGRYISCADYFDFETNILLGQLTEILRRPLRLFSSLVFFF